MVKASGDKRVEKLCWFAIEIWNQDPPVSLLFMLSSWAIVYLNSTTKHQASWKLLVQVSLVCFGKGKYCMARELANNCEYFLIINPSSMAASKSLGCLILVMVRDDLAIPDDNIYDVTLTMMTLRSASLHVQWSPCFFLWAKRRFKRWTHLHTNVGCSPTRLHLWTSLFLLMLVNVIFYNTIENFQANSKAHGFGWIGTIILSKTRWSQSGDPRCRTRSGVSAGDVVKAPASSAACGSVRTEPDGVKGTIVRGYIDFIFSSHWNWSVFEMELFKPLNKNQINYIQLWLL